MSADKRRMLTLQIATTDRRATVVLTLFGGDRDGYTLIDGADAVDAALEYLTAMKADMRAGIKTFLAPNSATTEPAR